MAHSLADFARDITALAAGSHMLMHEAMEKACIVVEEEAKHVLGTYDYGWAPLKPETIAHKSTGDSPLLETGEMKDSISHHVGSEYLEVVGYVGSTSKIAVYQELGTSRGIPPRSFLGGASMAKEHEVHELLGLGAKAMIALKP